MFINSSIPWSTDISKFNEIISLAYKVGYQAVIVNFNSLASYYEFQKTVKDSFPKQDHELELPISINWIKLYKSSKYCLPIIPRISIQAKNEQDLKNKLQNIKKFPGLISVDSTDQQVLEVAARDGRVDMINLDTLAHLQALTKGIMSLCKQNNCIIDLNWSSILTENKFQRSRILREYYKLFLSYRPNTYLYSIGAYPILLENSWLIRGPREIIHSLICLFEIPLDFAKSILKNNIEELALRFFRRDQGVFIEPGVEIVGKQRISSENRKEDIHDAD